MIPKEYEKIKRLENNLKAIKSLIKYIKTQKEKESRIKGYNAIEKILNRNMQEIRGIRRELEQSRLPLLSPEKILE